MTDINERFDRNVRLFGVAGQEKLRAASVAVVGVGGLGSHVVQQLALLGVGSIALIDNEELDVTNRNRYVGACWEDPIPGTAKVAIASRLVKFIDPSIVTSLTHATVLSAAAFDVLRKASHIFGCVDDDGPRFVLNDIATAYAKPFVDLASDVTDGSYGGRVFVNWLGDGCLYCAGEMDQTAVQRFLETDSERLNRLQVYGVDRSHLGGAGPSVVSINGVVASLAITEFMSACAGILPAKKFINYNGSLSRVFVRDVKARESCPYCGQWGIGDRADVYRYLRPR